jgi:hypothetical protein
MLADPKAVAFTDVMASQWMQGMVLKTSEPDPAIFPIWKPTLRTAMEQELRSFMEGIVKGTAPATDLLTANYTYANQELAQFYGLPSAGSLTDQFVRVDATRPLDVPMLPLVGSWLGAGVLLGLSTRLWQNPEALRARAEDRA